MNTRNIYFTLVGSVFLLVGCAPVYKCGEERPSGGIQGSSRLLEVVQERDELCDYIETKEEEYAYLIRNSQALTIRNDSLANANSGLKSEVRTLENSVSDLKIANDKLKDEKIEIAERYSSAITTNLNQGYLYDERIKEKERRLTEKEEFLQEREAVIRDLERKLSQQDSLAERLEYLIRRALLGFDADELTTKIVDRKVYVSMSDKLMFASGKTNVEPKGKKALQALAEVLAEHTEFDILVEGHTDNVPIKNERFDDNWDLSVVRATSIVRILQEEYEIAPLRLTASGKGEHEPKASNSTASERAKNRRTEIILYPNITIK